jgi:hypothetical protein
MFSFELVIGAKNRGCIFKGELGSNLILLALFIFL